jgi:hypothetical protein
LDDLTGKPSGFGNGLRKKGVRDSCTEMGVALHKTEFPMS